MKKISEMSNEEIEEEIKEYLSDFDQDENYVFVSYSHKDCEQVYPTVLRWMRKGYNVYLDLDFENHSGAENWVTQMRDRIRSNSCQLVTCFYSENYCFSYPAMIELLTIFSSATIKDREFANSPVLPIDIISMDNEPKNDGKNFSSPEVKNKYKVYFQQLKEKVGTKLWEKNPEEESLCEEGLKTLYQDEVNAEEAAKDTIERIKDTYNSAGMTNFYPFVAMIIYKVRNKNNLNGNNNLLAKYNEDIRFNGKDNLEKNREIYKFKRNADEADYESQSDSTEQSTPNNISFQDRKSIEAPEVTVEETDKTIAKDVTDKSDDGMLYYDFAFGKDNGLGGIIILKGSKISKTEANSCPDGARKNRSKALAEESITDEGSYYLLQKDIEFRSLSGAACFVSGTSVNGKTAWKSVKKSSTGLGRSSSRAEGAGIGSKINQICMVIKKVTLELKPIENYTKTINNIYDEVANELNIGKSSVVDKCQRQLGLKAVEFAKYVRDYNESSDDTLYNIVMAAAGNEDEKTFVRETFGKN